MMTSNKTLWGAMIEPPASLRGRVLRVAAASVAASGLLALSMGVVTHRLAGEAGLKAMAAALVIALFSNIIGTLPACWALGQPHIPSPKTLLGGMAIRVLVLCLLAVPAAWSGVFVRKALLLWLAGGYFVLLMIETALVSTWLDRHSRWVRS